MTRYRREVAPEHVGRRVTLRYRIDDEDHEVTDVVGELAAADDATFTVVRRSGEQVVVERALLLASKLLPEAPPPRRRSGPT